ncbi:MAG: glycosyltransferase family 2 protein [Candidatus Firestonebacteria bacterium]|nr:glycosyltransferase family 2 protein [Candidatus Firestonebacteria bacterium]
MPDAAPELSLIIVNWNTRDLLRACLTSLRPESQTSAWEVIVVDNASTDGSQAVLTSEFPEVLWINNTVNAGFAAATNQGRRRARGAVWVMLNPDTEVLPGALARLKRELEQAPELTAAGPQLLNDDRSLQPSGRRFPSLGRMVAELFFPKGWKNSRQGLRVMFGRADFSQPAWVEELSGACVMARRETFARVGLLDEAYFLYFEEVDWFRRLARLRGRARYVPAAQVVHHWGGGSSQAAEAGVLHNARSAFYYWRKFHGLSGVLALRALYALRALWGLAGQSAGALLGLRARRTFTKRARLHLNLLRLALGVQR